MFGALHLQTGMQEAKLFNFVSPGTHLWQVLVDRPPPLEPPVPHGDDHHVGLQHGVGFAQLVCSLLLELPLLLELQFLLPACFVILVFRFDSALSMALAPATRNVGG